MSDVCQHPDFEVYNLVHRVTRDESETSPMYFTVDVHVRCAVCKVRFRFLGLPMGLSRTRPMVSIDELELRAPIEPDAHLTSLMAGEDTGWPG